MTAPDLVDRIAAVGLPDVVVAGLPCQPFWVAGLRKGENDPRNLTARFVEIADAIDDLRRDDGQPPVWWLVENVPGLLSDRSNAFGALLGGMVGSASAIIPDGRWESAGVATGPRRSAAWRVLDAQFFGVAQRRRRVFALFVAGAANWRAANALLPIIDSMSWHSPPRRETRQVAAPTLSARTKGGGGLGTDFDCDGGLIARVADTLTVGANQYSGFPGEPVEVIASTGDVAHCLNAHGGPCGRMDFESETMVAHTLKAEGFDASEDGTGRQNLIPEVAGTMKACRDSGAMPEGPHDTANIRAASGGSSRSYIAQPWAVRRLLPVECEALQGFPRNHTAVKHRGKPAADGPRYKALGNSMAVPVIRWIMDRMRLSMGGVA